jgi:C_GCAxxG_C_C family probable redox protein
MVEIDAVATARARFLEEGNPFGCAETTFMVLKGVYGLDDPTDTSAAMALNGGVAYSGGTCGAITGAALAVGLLAGRRIEDHRAAKRVARQLVASLMDEFQAAQGAVDCRDLIGIDLRAPGGHDAFIAGGVWRDRCLHSIEFAVGRMAPLIELDAWSAALEALGPADS